MYSEIKNSLKEQFTFTGDMSSRRIKCLDEKYKAWGINIIDEYGVAIENRNSVEIAESFSSVTIKNRNLIVDGKNVNVITLTCDDASLKNSFVHLCANFCDPGENGGNRDVITNNPLSWWKEWSSLLGNVNREQMVYDVIAEMHSFVKILEQGDKAQWSAMHKGSHDIETVTCAYEIKSTVTKSSYYVQISSQFQLDVQDKLYLVFCRMEKSALGESINDLVEKCNRLGCNISEIEQYLESIGFAKGNHKRSEKYAMIEGLRYIVDDEFPAITNKSFKNDVFPDNIVHITYTLDLAGLKGEKW